MKKYRHLVVLSDPQKEMLSQLEEKLGETSASLLRMGLIDLHRKHLPRYAEVKERALDIKQKQIDIIGSGEPFKSLRDISLVEQGEKVCTDLGGKVKNGICEWPLYQRHKSSSRILTWEDEIETMALNKKLYEEKQYEAAGGKDAYLDFCKENHLNPYSLQLSTDDSFAENKL